MWEAEFDVSMLNGDGVFIHCPEKDLAHDLMRILEDQGVRWLGDGHPTSHTNWNGNKHYYRVDSERSMTYGSVDDISFIETFPEYIKCTFYGERANEADELDQINEDEWAALIEIVR